MSISKIFILLYIYSIFHYYRLLYLLLWINLFLYITLFLYYALLYYYILLYKLKRGARLGKSDTSLSTGASPVITYIIFKFTTWNVWVGVFIICYVSRIFVMHLIPTNRIVC